jgi:hypothetical protein
VTARAAYTVIYLCALMLGLLALIVALLFVLAL